MNIFYLDANPKIAAEYHCDKHVCKMIVETAQLLSTAHRILDPLSDTSNGVYKAAYINHPMAVWTRESSENYMYAYELYRALLAEYTLRYSKVHRSGDIKDYLSQLPNGIAKGARTPIPQCMPDQYKVKDNPIKAYQAYYLGEKARFAKWKSPRTIPYFMPNTSIVSKIDWRTMNHAGLSSNKK